VIKSLLFDLFAIGRQRGQFPPGYAAASSLIAGIS
jgi:hypothetical protein